MQGRLSPDSHDPQGAGSRVVLWDDRHGDGTNSQTDVYGFDLATKTEIPIRSGAWGVGDRAVSGKTVAWTDSRNGDNAEIYGLRPQRWHLVGDSCVTQSGRGFVTGR